MISDDVTKKLLKDKKYEEIDNLLKDLPSNEKTPQQFLAHYRALSSTNQREKAHSVIDAAILAHSDDLSIRIMHAEIAMASADWDIAIKRWQNIITNFGNSTLGVFWRQAAAYLNKRDFENARKVALFVGSKSQEQIQKVNDFISIIESEQAKKYEVVISKYENTLKFNIDSVAGQSTLGKLDFLKCYTLRGWVKATSSDVISLIIKKNNKIQEYQLNKIRKDVKEYFSSKGEIATENSGFEYIIDITDGVEIGFLVNNIKYWVADIKTIKQIDVVRGKENWLFLANDSNRSTDQFTGKMLLTKAADQEWQQFSKTLLNYNKRYNLLYVIANSKEKVNPEKYPFDIGEVTITEQLEIIFNNYNIKYLNPMAFLKSKFGTYYKTDTHWSDYGAYVAFTQVMVKTNYDNPLIDITFIDIEAAGDLGSKVSPVERSSKKCLSSNLTLSNNIVFDNKLSGTGMIRISVNQKAVYKKTVLVFGGSSMTEGAFDKYIGYSFERVILINLPGALVDEIIQEETPDLIINLTNERYLAKPGKLYDSFHESPLSTKLSSLSVKEKKITLSIINKFADESFYKNLTIESLNIAK